MDSKFARTRRIQSTRFDFCALTLARPCHCSSKGSVLTVRQRPRAIEPEFFDYIECGGQTHERVGSLELIRDFGVTWHQLKINWRSELSGLGALAKNVVEKSLTKWGDEKTGTM